MTDASTFDHAGRASTLDLKDSWHRLVVSGARYAGVRLAGYLDRAQHAVKAEVDEPVGVPEGAAVEVVKAVATHRSPLWALVRGAWSGADAKTRAAVIAVLLLLAVLSPVLLLLGIIVALIIAAIAAIRAASR
jgi:hypothetical protein